MTEGDRRIQLAQDIYLDKDAQAVSKGEILLPLSSIEFRLLDYLTKHAGQVIPVEALAKIGWADGWTRSSQDVYYHIHRVRRVLGDIHRPYRVIQSRRGAGYILVTYHTEVKG